MVKKANLTLDVGCGNVPRGDVNCDLYAEDNIHRDFSLHPQKIRNFVKCDAHYLPFKKGSFAIVYAHHLIEHLRNPIQCLQELIRVASRRVVVHVPWRDGFLTVFHRNEGHKWSFSKKWFWQFARVYGLSIDVRYSESTWLPVEIEATIYKVTKDKFR